MVCVIHTSLLPLSLTTHARTCVIMLGATCFEGGGLEPIDKPLGCCGCGVGAGGGGLNMVGMTGITGMVGRRLGAAAAAGAAGVRVCKNRGGLCLI